MRRKNGSERAPAAGRRFRLGPPVRLAAAAVGLACARGEAGERLADPGFESLPPGALAATGARGGWEVQLSGRDAVKPRLRVECVEDRARAKSGSKCISLSIPADTVGFEFVTMSMRPETSNFESAQLWQRVELREGARYEVGCRMRWDSFATGEPAPIVNYGVYHEPSRTWYGPVDQVLERTPEWRVYRFPHAPPAGGAWKLYVQLNGWGNFGRGVEVSFDDFTCTPAAVQP